CFMLPSGVLLGVADIDFAHPEELEIQPIIPSSAFEPLWLIGGVCPSRQFEAIHCTAHSPLAACDFPTAYMEIAMLFKSQFYGALTLDFFPHIVLVGIGKRRHIHAIADCVQRLFDFGW